MYMCIPAFFFEGSGLGVPSMLDKSGQTPALARPPGHLATSSLGPLASENPDLHDYYEICNHLAPFFSMAQKGLAMLCHGGTAGPGSPEEDGLEFPSWLQPKRTLGSNVFFLN